MAPPAIVSSKASQASAHTPGQTPIEFFTWRAQVVESVTDLSSRSQVTVSHDSQVTITGVPGSRSSTGASIFHRVLDHMPH